MCENIYFRGILLELLVTKEPKDEGENCGMLLLLGKQNELSPGYREGVTNLSRGVLWKMNCGCPHHGPPL